MQSFLFRSLSFTGWCEQYHWGEQMEARHFFLSTSHKKCQKFAHIFSHLAKNWFCFVCLQHNVPRSTKTSPTLVIAFSSSWSCLFDIMRTTLKVVVALVEGKSSSLSGRGAHNHSYDNCWW